MIEAILAALCWGGTDALAGISSRRSTAVLAAFWLHVASLAALVPFLMYGKGSGGFADITPQDAVYGLLAGVLAAVGDVLFGKAATISKMSVGIPLANVVATAVPVSVAMLQGATVTGIAMAGIGGALLACWFASTPANGELEARGAKYAISAGLCFGAMYGLLGQVHAAQGIPVIFLMRSAGTVALLPGVWMKRVQASRQAVLAGLPAGLLSGIASVSANYLFVLAESIGPRAIIPVVAVGLSAPAGMLIANMACRERLTKIQMASASFAVAALAVLAVQG